MTAGTVDQLESAIHAAVPGARLECHLEGSVLVARLGIHDARELAEALARGELGECGGIETCVWATLHTNLGYVEELAAQAHELALELPLRALLWARARRRIRRWWDEFPLVGEWPDGSSS